MEDVRSRNTYSGGRVGACGPTPSLSPLPRLPLARAEGTESSGEDPCAAEPLEAYDLPLHIASIFILLAVSLLGSLGPLAVRMSSRHPAVAAAIRLGSFFGEMFCPACVWGGSGADPQASTAGKQAAAGHACAKQVLWLASL